MIFNRIISNRNEKKCFFIDFHNFVCQGQSSLEICKNENSQEQPQKILILTNTCYQGYNPEQHLKSFISWTL